MVLKGRIWTVLTCAKGDEEKNGEQVSVMCVYVCGKCNPHCRRKSVVSWIKEERESLLQSLPKRGNQERGQGKRFSRGESQQENPKWLAGGNKLNFLPLLGQSWMISNLPLALNIPVAKAGHLSQLYSSEFLAYTQPTCWWGGVAIVWTLDSAQALFSKTSVYY